jgi:transcriptional regulator with XRE-family HTH domain
MDMGQPILPSQNGTNKELGERIRRARTEVGLSQAEFGRRLAEAIGRRRPLSQAAISDMERGDAPVSIDLIPKIASILEKGPSYFSSAQAPSREAFNNLTRANYTLEKWKEAAHLDSQFPQLRPLDDEDLDEEKKLYLGEDHRRLVEEIQDRAGLVGGSDPLIVQVSRGQGCTTLSNYVFTQMSKRFRQSRAIPIRLTLAKMGGSGGVAAVSGYVEERVRWGIVEHLISPSWLRGRSEKGRCISLLKAMSHLSESGDSEQSKHYNALSHELEAVAEIVEYPWYRASDVLGMLAHQYLELQYQRPRAEALMSVVDPKLLEGIVGPRIPLVETVRLLERRLIRIAADWEEAPGQLSITAMVASASNLRRPEILRPSVTLLESADSRTSSA